MPDKNTIARPYAKAAFEAASGHLDAWSGALRRAAQGVADPRVAALLGNPRVTRGALVELVTSIAAPRPEPALRNFIDLLAGNHRLACLPEISARFDALKAEAERTIDVEVAAACELSEVQQRMLAEALQRRLQRTVRLHCVHDPALLGGARVRAGDLVIDGSLRGRLERIRHQLAA